MSESPSTTSTEDAGSLRQPFRTGSTEADVEQNADQVEPGNDSSYVGRVAGDDVGYAGEQGAEARANADDD